LLYTLFHWQKTINVLAKLPLKKYLMIPHHHHSQGVRKWWNKTLKKWSCMFIIILVCLSCQVQEWFEVGIKEIIEYIDNNFLFDLLTMTLCLSKKGIFEHLISNVVCNDLNYKLQLIVLWKKQVILATYGFGLMFFQMMHVDLSFSLFPFFFLLTILFVGIWSELCTCLINNA